MTLTLSSHYEHVRCYCRKALIPPVHAFVRKRVSCRYALCPYRHSTRFATVHDSRKCEITTNAYIEPILCQFSESSHFYISEYCHFWPVLKKNHLYNWDNFLSGTQSSHYICMFWYSKANSFIDVVHAAEHYWNYPFNQLCTASMSIGVVTCCICSCHSGATKTLVVRSS